MDNAVSNLRRSLRQSAPKHIADSNLVLIHMSKLCNTTEPLTGTIKDSALYGHQNVPHKHLLPRKLTTCGLLIFLYHGVMVIQNLRIEANGRICYSAYYLREIVFKAI